MLFSTISFSPPFTSPTSLQNVVPQKVQEISSTSSTTCTSGDSNLYTSRTARLRRSAGPGHSSRRCGPFDWDPTDGADLAAVTGANNGAGYQDRGNEDRQFYALGASNWTPEREDSTKSERMFHYSR